MVIYKITNKINKKIYIGQTVRPLKRRWSEHCKSAFKKDGNSTLYRAMNKYGIENFKITIISTCENMEQMNHREKYYIKLFNTLSPNGYNLMSGGKSGGFASKEVVETNRKNSILMHIEHPEIAINHSLMLKKRYLDHPELLVQLALSKGGKPFKVFYKSTTSLVWEGINQGECERLLGVSQGNISSCLNFKKKTCNGYIFRYVGEEDVKWAYRPGVRKNVQNIETEEIFVSVAEAANKYKTGTSNISRAIRKGWTAGRYHWRYA